MSLILQIDILNETKYNVQENVFSTLLVKYCLFLLIFI